MEPNMILSEQFLVGFFSGAAITLAITAYIVHKSIAAEVKALEKDEWDSLND